MKLKSRPKLEMVKTIEDIVDILSNIVVRDFGIALRKGHDGNDDLIHVSRPCVLRDFDRKYQSDPYLTVQDFKVVERQLYDYDSRDYWAASKVGPVEGFFSVPPLPIPKSAFVGLVLRFCAKLELHELQENFYYEGERIFDPHEGDGEILYKDVITVSWQA